MLFDFGVQFWLSPQLVERRAALLGPSDHASCRANFAMNCPLSIDGLEHRRELTAHILFDEPTATVTIEETGYCAEAIVFEAETTLTVDFDSPGEALG